MDIAFEGKPYWFLTFTGKVASVSAWTTTSVTSSGGGGSGYIHPQHGGYISVSAPKVSSQTHNHQTFWLVSPDGREEKINNKNFSCREGQEATVIWGAAKGKERGKYLAIRNDTTGDISFFDDSTIWETFHGFGTIWKNLSLIYFSIIFIAFAWFLYQENQDQTHAPSGSVLTYILFFLLPVLFLLGYCHVNASREMRKEKCQSFVLSILKT